MDKDEMDEEEEAKEERAFQLIANKAWQWLGELAY